MRNPERPQSPLDRLGIVLTPEEQEEVLRRVEQRAIEEAEDDQPASLTYDSESHVRWDSSHYISPYCYDDEDF